MVAVDDDTPRSLPSSLTDEGPGQRGEPCAERIQAAVRAVLEDRDRLLSVAAHEIRTPLASLRLYLDALIKAADRGTLDPAGAAVRLRKAQRQCDRLNVLLSNMMDATRVESRPLSLLVEPVDLVAVVTAACDRLRDQFTHQGRTLDVQAPPGPLSGDWDRGRLEQVMNNLLSNVYKHAPGASARVGVERTGNDRVLLRVSDDGPGIPAEVRARLFDRTMGARPAKTGMGLGLWIVAQIVDAFGGTISLEGAARDSVESESKTGSRPGTSFAIVLPLQRPTARSEDPPLAPSP